MNNNDKIRAFFLKILSKRHNSLDEDYVSRVNAYSDEELERAYSELKSISERKGTIANSLIFVVFLSFLGGLYKVFVDFSKKITDIYGSSEKSLVLMNGLLFISIVVFIIVSTITIFYLYRVNDKKKKYYYIEVLMKQRRLLG